MASTKVEDDPPYTISLYTDTLKSPPGIMCDEMKTPVDSDGVYQKLEIKAAEMLGKEKALFVPTSTMANLIAMLVHCDSRGCEVLTGDQSYIYIYGRGGAQLANVHINTIPNKPDGTFDLEELKQKIKVNPDSHELRTGLIIVENTHNWCGGKVLPLIWLHELSLIAKENDIKVHMDGARLFNAVVASKMPASDIVRDCDSVNFCLSKALGAPIGSILAGSTDFIEKAIRTRRMLGGLIRQGAPGVAGLVAIEKMISLLEIDHFRTRKLAKALSEIETDVMGVDIENCETNILMIRLNTSMVTADKFINRMMTATDEEKDSIGNLSVRLNYKNEDTIRAVLYGSITDKDIELTIKKFKYVIQDLEKELIKEEPEED